MQHHYFEPQGKVYTLKPQKFPLQIHVLVCAAIALVGILLQYPGLVSLPIVFIIFIWLNHWQTRLTIDGNAKEIRGKLGLISPAFAYPLAQYRGTEVFSIAGVHHMAAAAFDIDGQEKKMPFMQDMRKAAVEAFIEELEAAVAAARGAG